MRSIVSGRREVKDSKGERRWRSGERGLKRRRQRLNDEEGEKKGRIKGEKVRLGRKSSRGRKMGERW